MFDFQIPQSLADLPGRVIGTGKHAIARRPKRTYAERLAQMRARTAAIPREVQRQRDRESYARLKGGA